MQSKVTDGGLALAMLGLIWHGANLMLVCPLVRLSASVSLSLSLSVSQSSYSTWHTSADETTRASRSRRRPAWGEREGDKREQDGAAGVLVVLVILVVALDSTFRGFASGTVRRCATSEICGVEVEMRRWRCLLKPSFVLDRAMRLDYLL